MKLTTEQMCQIERQIFRGLLVNGSASMHGYDFKVLKEPGIHKVAMYKGEDLISKVEIDMVGRIMSDFLIIVQRDL